ncbi:MAG: family efflux pump [Candidatus Adlerbacteria bacterium]|nr:family efflux pump [Candidatus Adlerbacteria bacterium]
MLWLWNFFLERRQLSYVLIVVLLVAGAYAVIRIPKENTPQIDLAIAVVTASLPGASAEDMESLVTNKLEAQISGVSNIDTLTSSSGDGMSVITVQFTAQADTDQSIQDLRDAVSRARANLPGDVESPQVTKINFSDQPIIAVSISGERTPLEFSRLGTDLQDQLLNISGVSQVQISGVPEREVSVIVRKEALEQYGLRVTDVIQAISSANAALPAGRISMDGVSYNVNFKGGITDPSQLQDIAISSTEGVPVYLRDIADIQDGLAAATTYSRVSLHGEPSRDGITLLIYKQSSAGIQDTAERVGGYLKELQSTTLSGLDVFVPPSTDQGVQVKEQLGDLTETGLITVVLVILVLLVTIGWRESVVAGLAIPLSFLIAFIGLYFTGNTLNFISLFALILAVGILVDSGIVVTEAIHARLKHYPTPVLAAKAALHDYAWPLIAGTMATVAVFAPLFFLTGIIGKFISGIPYTLIFVLIASIFVALGIVPLIAVLFTKGAPNRMEQKQEEYTAAVTSWYTKKLRVILEHRRYQNIFLTGLFIAMIGAFMLPVFGLVGATFFPSGDTDYVYLNLQKPQGTVLEQTDLTVREVEEILYSDEDVDSFQTTVGASSALTGAGTSGSNQANITINLHEDRKKTSAQIGTELQAALAGVKGADIQVLQASDGPPSGAPIFIEFIGDDLGALITAADRGKQLLSSMPNVTNITATTQANGTEFNLAIDRAKAASLGLNTSLVGQTLRAAINGTKATSITQNKENIDVVVKLNLNPAYTGPGDTAQTTIDSIKNLAVEGASGNTVLLGSVLKDTLGLSSAAIAHKEKNRIQTVSAYPDASTNAAAVVAEFQKREGELNLQEGVRVSYGGEAESINESFTQMFVALLAGLVLMFLILVISFNSIRYTFYLLYIVPLSLIGVLGGLALTGQSLSFTSLLGIIGLGGVIINHAIILMDSLIHNMHASPDKPMIDVVLESAEKRFRPILLTTIATAIGMIPLALSNPTWGPFAFTVMFGLIFAICLTLVVVPVLFFRAPHHKSQ